MPSEDEIEQLAVKHEAFGFGLADVKGYTTHGFDPDGLESFVREVLERWGAPAHQFRAIPTNEARYLWLAAYLVSDRQDADNAIVGASTIDELSSVIDKEMLKPLLIRCPT